MASKDTRDIGFSESLTGIITKFLIGLASISTIIPSFLNNLADLFHLPMEAAFRLFIALYFIGIFLVLLIALGYIWKVPAFVKSSLNSASAQPTNGPAESREGKTRQARQVFLIILLFLLPLMVFVLPFFCWVPSAVSTFSILMLTLVIIGIITWTLRTRFRNNYGRSETDTLYFAFILLVIIGGLAYFGKFNAQEADSPEDLEAPAKERRSGLIPHAPIVHDHDPLVEHKKEDSAHTILPSRIFQDYDLWMSFENKLVPDAMEYRVSVYSRRSTDSTYLVTASIDSVRLLVQHPDSIRKGDSLFRHFIGIFNNISAQLYVTDTAVRHLKQAVSELNANRAYINQGKFRVCLTRKQADILYNYATLLRHQYEVHLSSKWSEVIRSLAFRGLLWFLALLVFCASMHYMISKRLEVYESPKPLPNPPEALDKMRLQWYRNQLGYELPVSERTDKDKEQALRKAGYSYRSAILVIVLLMVPFFKKATPENINLRRPFLNFSPSDILNMNPEGPDKGSGKMARGDVPPAGAQATDPFPPACDTCAPNTARARDTLIIVHRDTCCGPTNIKCPDCPKVVCPDVDAKRIGEIVNTYIGANFSGVRDTVSRLFIRMDELRKTATPDIRDRLPRLAGAPVPGTGKKG